MSSRTRLLSGLGVSLVTGGAVVMALLLGSSASASSGFRIARLRVANDQTLTAVEGPTGAIVIRGLGTATTIVGRTVYDRTGGELSIVHYARGMDRFWAGLADEYGSAVSKRSLLSALKAGGATSASEFSQLAPADSSSYTTTITEYGTDLAALESASPTRVASLGSGVLGYSLGDAQRFDISDPDGNSGTVNQVMYTTDPSNIGAGDSEILITAEPDSTAQGQRDLGMIDASSDPSYPAADGATAYAINSGQILFDDNGTVVSITTQATLSADDLATVAQSVTLG